MLKKAEGFEGQVNIVIPRDMIIASNQNPLINSLYITDIGYYPCARFHHRERPEGIDQHILIYAIEGKGIINSGSREFKILPGNFFVIPANTSHSYSADLQDPWTIYWIHFMGSKSHLFSILSDVPRAIEPSAESRISDRISLFHEILDHLSMGYSRENMEYSNMLLWYLMASFLHIKAFRELNRAVDNDIVKRAILYMKNNVGKKLSLADLAGHVNLSASHFTRVFTLRTRKSPVDYLIQMKIQQASQFLDFTNMKISEIARKVGYEDPHYFSRLFKKSMNLSPIQYRKRSRGQVHY